MTEVATPPERGRIPISQAAAAISTPRPRPPAVLEWGIDHPTNLRHKAREWGVTYGNDET